MLQKAIYLNEYTDGWERFNETSLTKKKEFYSKVSMESIADADYKHAKRVWEDFVLQKPLRYPFQYLCVQSDISKLQK